VCVGQRSRRSIVSLCLLLGALTMHIGCGGSSNLFVSGGAHPATTPQPDSLINDGSFELSAIANGWVVDPTVATQGQSFRSTTAVNTGHFSMEVAPNSSNTPSNRLNAFGVSQFIPAASLRGKPVYFGGYLWARDGATAVLRVFTLGATAIELREVRQETGATGPVLLRDVMDVPTDPSVTTIVITCAVEGVVGAAYFDDVTLTTVMPDYVRSLSQVQTSPIHASVTVTPNKEIRRIPATLYGINVEWGWDAQGVWNEQARAITPGVSDLMQNMGVTELRFPGGILSDLYHWSDGIGPPENRPGPVVMPGGSLSSNAFGTNEALQLADSVGANLMITANVLTGTPQEAADWVRYLKSSGHTVPRWEVGNELYLDFTQFNPPMNNWTAEQYASTFLQFATAMRAADPAIQLGAGLEYSLSPSAFRVHPDWEKTVLQNAARQIDFVAVHNAFAPVLPIEDAGWDGRTVYSTLFAAPLLVKKSLDRLSDEIDTYAGPYAPHITVSVTEWGPGFKIEPDSRWVDHLKTLGSGIYAADILKGFIESPRVMSAHAFKLSDGAAQGWLGIRDNAFVAKPVALALEMYSKHFGTRLIPCSTDVPGYESRSLGLVDAVNNVPYLDVVCSLDDSGQNLYIMGINKSFDQPVQTSIDMGSYRINGSTTAWTLNGTAVDANPGTDLPVYPGIPWAQQAGVDPNSRIDQGGPGEVSITSAAVSITGSQFVYAFPAHSITALIVSIQGASPAATPADAQPAASTRAPQISIPAATSRGGSESETVTPFLD
jgi:alpha-L-arabinofuranosidase